MRLDHLLSRQLGVRKRAAQQLITQGVVAVDGESQTSASFQVILGGVDRVTVDGEQLPVRPWNSIHRVMQL
jgi:16S rRNA U516 pseudouridylate synthase RsuA-like enzyme